MSNAYNKNVLVTSLLAYRADSANILTKKCLMQKLTIYEIAVLTGDLSKPLTRVPISSIEKLYAYTSKFDSKQECSVITRVIEGSVVTTTNIFFGEIQTFLKKIDRSGMV